MPLPATARTRTYRLGLPWLLAGGFLCPVMAQTGFAAPVLGSVEVSSSAIALDAPDRPMRVDVTRWMPPGRAGSLGFSLGMVLPTQRDLRPYATTTAPWKTDVGVRWRMPLGSDHQLDMAVWARTNRYGQESDAMGMIWRQEQSRYGTRLELQWTSSRTHGLMPEFGAVGVQLEGDSRLLLRVRRGGPMLYYRTRF